MCRRASTSVRTLAVARGLAQALIGARVALGALPVQDGEQFDVVVCQTRIVVLR